MAQREIKFRAWTGKSMVEFRLHEIDGGSITTADGNDNEDAAYTSIEKLKVMQYTGLKDKNGVEIYEGDVLDETGNVFEVQWVEGDAGFNFDVRTSRTAFVIGNIYENPELLSGG